VIEIWTAFADKVKTDWDSGFGNRESGISSQLNGLQDISEKIQSEEEHTENRIMKDKE
jgi:hypothetical protein